MSWYLESKKEMEKWEMNYNERISYYDLQENYREIDINWESCEDNNED